jgi:hypothetical protein
MRLIDVDKLKEYFPKNSDWEYPVNTNQYVSELIDEQPTVEAIPIEWLEGIIGMLKMHYEFGNEETREPSYYGFRVLQSVINGWRKHNETD